MKRVLIICTGNSCRSQMAEGWLRDHGKGAIMAYSAGTMPSFVHPTAIKVMAEKGIDISRHRSKSVDEFVDAELDYAVTVCDHARETCPVLPGSHVTMHTPFEDPVGYEGSPEERLEKFREVRDLIGAAMKRLAAEVLADEPAP